MSFSRWGWWFLLTVSASLASSCLDFKKVESEFCDGGNSVACPEHSCANGLDDDNDQSIDCGDPDCRGLPCNPGELCVASPVCQANGRCEGTIDPSLTCDDSSACTAADHCGADAGCSGSPVVCNQPPGACFALPTGCDPVLGCVYPVRVDAGCTDGNPCTFNDRCGVDGGCTGTAYSCLNNECASSTCLGDGGCSTVLRTGQPCDGGVCQANGNCITFAYSPSNFDPVAIAARGFASNVVISCAAWFNSTDGGGFWCSGQPVPVQTVITQDGGPSAVVLAMTGLTVSSGSSLALSGSRPIILAAWGDVTINGTISAQSSRSGAAGAGANSAGLCDAQNGVDGGGGGGGSYGSFGGTGGRGRNLAGFGASGGSFSVIPTIVPLRGGCPGGNGELWAGGSVGGSGGGAVQISAAGLLSVSGTVTASGAGGLGGAYGQGGNGGGAGGSGGAVLLEGQSVWVPNAAKLTANGGGGGQGSSTVDGNPGSDGSLGASSPAPGGSGVSGAGNGGAGGAAFSSAQIGENGASSCGGGGGGGSVGRIRVNGYSVCDFDAGMQSPLATFGGVCP